MARKSAVSEPKESGVVRHWLSEIAAAQKREKDYRTHGRKIREIYAGQKPEATPFNILFSNSEVLLPSLYSQVPRPVVERRYKDADPTGKAAAVAGQRVLEFLLDTNVEGYETFHEGMKSTTIDGLLPGRGVCAVKYDADLDETDPEVPVKRSELVCLDTKSWDRVLLGYAKKWSKVPWIAYPIEIDKAEAKRLFGDTIADAIEYTTGGDEEDGKRSKDEQNRGERKTALVYQIWDKAGGRKVRYISRHYPDAELLVQDDPLELTGFFNTPRPLMFVDKTDDLTPTALYTLYENQATELNSLTVRISRIIKAIKARGIYDGTLGDDIANLMDADDNELIPADKGASLAAEKGLQNAIWFMPLDVLITTLRELYAAREQCKQVIYEIMGISDIVRGASKASETLGAQQLKSQWGTLRLKNKQAEVQRYSRDLLRMMLEIAASKFSPETWVKMTGLPYLTDEQAMQLQQQAQAMQQQAMQVQQQAVATGQQIPPEIQQQAQQQMHQVQAELQKPKWSDVLGMLKDDMQRAYRIDIETNSTIEPEAAEDQKNIAELMTAMSQFLNGVGPMVQQGIMPFDVAKTMLTTVTRRFRFGRDIEEQISQMQPPKPQDDGAAQKAQAAAMQQQAESQKALIQKDGQIAQLQTQLKQSEAEKALQSRETDLAVEQLTLKTERNVFEMEKKQQQESLTNRTTVANTQLDAKKQISGLEGKQAQEKQQVAKSMDMKVTQGLKQITEVVTQLSQQQQQVVQLIASQQQQLQSLTAAISGSQGQAP